MEAGRRSSVTLKPAIAGSNPAPLASAGGVAKRPKAPVPKPEQHQHIRLPNNFIAMGRRDLVIWICGFNTTLRFGGETQDSLHIHRLQLNTVAGRRPSVTSLVRLQSRAQAHGPTRTGHPSSEGLHPSVTPYPPLTDLFTGRNEVGSLPSTDSNPTSEHTSVSPCRVART